MGHPKILVMVLAADVPPHDAMVKAIKETWGRWRNDRLQTIYYWGHKRLEKPPLPGEARLDGDDLLLGIEEGVHAVTPKTLLAYKFALENFEFDYLFRCCSGSFVVPHLLLEFSEKKPREGLFCGVINDKEGTPFHYVSGAGMLISRDVVQLISKNAKRVMEAPFSKQWDDVCVGKVILDLGIPLDGSGMRTDDTDSIIKGCYHYHFRTSEKTMRSIHRKLAGSTK